MRAPMDAVNHDTGKIEGGPKTITRVKVVSHKVVKQSMKAC
jgi:hypothetical protein